MAWPSAKMPRRAGTASTTRRRWLRAVTGTPEPCSSAPPPVPGLEHAEARPDEDAGHEHEVEHVAGVDDAHREGLEVVEERDGAHRRERTRRGRRFVP